MFAPPHASNKLKDGNVRLPNSHTLTCSTCLTCMVHRLSDQGRIAAIRGSLFFLSREILVVAGLRAAPPTAYSSSNVLKTVARVVPGAPGDNKNR